MVRDKATVRTEGLVVSSMGRLVSAICVEGVLVSSAGEERLGVEPHVVGSVLVGGD